MLPIFQVIMGKLRKTDNEENRDNFRSQGLGFNSNFENDRSCPVSTEILHQVDSNSLKCQNGCLTTSQKPCKFCSLSEQLRLFYEWFPRLGEQNKRICLLGLVHRLVDCPFALQRVCEILSPTTRKDFMYANSRTAPSLETDSSTVSSDRTLTTTFVNKAMLMTWHWYEKAIIWSKVNFLMVVLQSCDVHLLHAVNNYAKALLETQDEQTAMVSKQDSGKKKFLLRLKSNVVMMSSFF